MVYQVCYQIYSSYYELPKDQGDKAIAQECLYYVTVYQMSIYKDLGVNSTSSTYFKQQLLSDLYKRFPQYDPKAKPTKQPSDVMFTGQFVSLNFMALFQMIFDPRIVEQILLRYLKQIEEQTLSEDFSFID